MVFAVLTDRDQTKVEREVKQIVSDDPDRSIDSCVAIPHTNSVSTPKPTVSVISAFLQSVGRDSNVKREKRASLVDEFRHYRFLVSKLTDSGEDQDSALQFWPTYSASLYPYFLILAGDFSQHQISVHHQKQPPHRRVSLVERDAVV